jgi:hypothetical protein
MHRSNRLLALSALVFALCALLFATAQAADRPDPKLVAETTRYLHAIQFGETFLGGVRKANSAEGQGSAFLDRILTASPEEIESTVAPAFAGHLTLKEARGLADFFSGPVGHKAVTQGEKALSAAETRELERFGQTPLGKLAVTLPTDPAIRQEYFALLQAKYSP